MPANLHGKYKWARLGEGKVPSPVREISPEGSLGLLADSGMEPQVSLTNSPTHWAQYIVAPCEDTRSNPTSKAALWSGLRLPCPCLFPRTAISQLELNFIQFKFWCLRFFFFFPLQVRLVPNPLTSCIESLHTQQTTTLMIHSYSWYRSIHGDTGFYRKNIRFSGIVTVSRAVPLFGAGRGSGDSRRHPGGERGGGVCLGRLYLHFLPLVSLSGKLGPSLGLWKWLQGSLYQTKIPAIVFVTNLAAVQ